MSSRASRTQNLGGQTMTPNQPELGAPTGSSRRGRHMPTQSADDSDQAVAEWSAAGNGRSPVVGLENLGNTCFMNCSLQQLLHVKPLVAYFLKEDVQSKVNARSCRDGILCASFSQLCKDVIQANNASTKSIAPVKFKKAVAKYAPYLLDFQQQDCHEFLRFMLDGLSEDMCRSELPDRTKKKAPATATAASGGGSNSGTPAKRAPNTDNNIGTSTPPPLVSARSLDSTIVLRQQQQATPGEGGEEANNANGVNGGATPSPARASLSEKLRVRVEAARQSPTAATAATATAGGGRGGVNDVSQLSISAKSELDSTEVSATTTGEETAATSNGDGDGDGDGPATDSTVTNDKDDTKAAAAAAAGDAQPESDGTQTVPGQQTTDSASAASGSTSGAVPSSLSVQEEADKAWKSYLKMNDSVVTDLFAGMTQSAVECQTCKNVTRSFEPFLDLSVAIPRAESKSLLQKTLRATGATADGGGGKATLDACLGAYTASEKLDDMFDCEKCKQKRKAVKRLSIFRAPRILVVCIKRFYFKDMMHREKISTHVDFKSEGLDLTPFLTETLHGHVDVKAGACAPASQGGQVTYDLLSISNHAGQGMNGGHYFAYVDVNRWNDGSSSSQQQMAGHKAKWVVCDDERVQRIKKAEGAGSSAYMLFWKLRE